MLYGKNSIDDDRVTLEMIKTFDAIIKAYVWRIFWKSFENADNVSQYRRDQIVTSPGGHLFDHFHTFIQIQPRFLGS